MDRRTLALMLGSAALTAAAPPPSAWPSYPAVKAHIESHTIAQLSAEVFGASPPDRFVRAGGFQPHPGRSGSITLWTKPDVVEVRPSGPIRAVCRLRTASAIMQSLDPPSFSEPNLHWQFKALPRQAGQPEPADLADACARLDPRSYDDARDPAIFGDSMAALHAVIAQPKSATLLNRVSCMFAVRAGPLCGLKTDDLLTRSMSVEAGDCRTLADWQFRGRIPPPGFAPGRCYSFQRLDVGGFRLLITADAPHPSLAFEETMSASHSPSFLAPQQ